MFFEKKSGKDGFILIFLFFLLVYLDINLFSFSNNAFLRGIISVVASILLVFGVFFILYFFVSKIEKKIIEKEVSKEKKEDIKYCETFFCGRFKPWGERIFWRFGHALTLTITKNKLKISSIFSKKNITKNLQLFPYLNIKIPLKKIRKIKFGKSSLWPLTKTMEIFYREKQHEKTFILYFSFFGLPRETKTIIKALNEVGLKIIE